ncbi:MAG: hypothetical protein LBV30_06110 [Propionibacteriaceae bacterium]|jgi:hypothetical protein|nr:hypothetical protein [Propionibacteriaceae bacterium]
MPSRVNLPGAAELFRPTGRKPAPSGDAAADSQASGRVRHDEKITVYISSDELLELESTRLKLRRQGVSVDRGRIVRAALAGALADFERLGMESELVSRLGAE